MKTQQITNAQQMDILQTSVSPTHPPVLFPLFLRSLPSYLMANVVCFMLPELEVLDEQVKDALRSTLHTILFNRSLGPVETIVKTCEFFATSYCTNNNPEEKQSVDSAIGRFQTVIARSSNELVKDCFVLEFFETITESGFLGVGTRTKKLLWEQWKIPLRVHCATGDGAKKSSGGGYNQSPERPTNGGSPGQKQRLLEKEAQRRKGEVALQKAIMYIVDAVNRRVDHLPKRKLTSLQQSKTYDCEISLHSEQVDSRASLKPLMQSLSFRF